MKNGSRRRKRSQARWTRRTRALPALSVRQPYAWLIVNGYKDVENRSRRTRRRGPVLIHAGLNRTWLKEEALRSIEQRHEIKLPRTFDRGGIVGMVEIVDCRRTVASPWHQRGYSGWILAKPQRLAFRPCKGALGLFRPRFNSRAAYTRYRINS